MRLFPHQLNAFDLKFLYFIFWFPFHLVHEMMNEHSNSLSIVIFFFLSPTRSPRMGFISGLALCCVRHAVQYPIEMREYLPQFIINFQRYSCLVYFLLLLLVRSFVLRWLKQSGIYTFDLNAALMPHVVCIRPM